MKILLLLLFATTSCNVTQESRVHEYCNEYIPTAQLIELHMGIPSSIQLAQAYYESHVGRSYIGRTANNFFGMRCGSNYDGYRAYTESGCWRCYDTALESWVDHALFIREHYSQAIGKPYSFYKDLKGYGGSGYWNKIHEFIERHGLAAYDLTHL